MAVNLMLCKKGEKSKNPCYSKIAVLLVGYIEWVAAPQLGGALRQGKCGAGGAGGG